MLEMPRHASPLECLSETRAELIAISRSRTGEVRMVERARIVLACLEGKEIQQVAQEVGASVPTVSKWRSRFAQDGVRGLRDRRDPASRRLMTPLFATVSWLYWSRRHLPAKLNGTAPQ